MSDVLGRMGGQDEKKWHENPVSERETTACLSAQDMDSKTTRSGRIALFLWPFEGQTARLPLLSHTPSISTPSDLTCDTTAAPLMMH